MTDVKPLIKPLWFNPVTGEMGIEETVTQYNHQYEHNWMGLKRYTGESKIATPYTEVVALDKELMKQTIAPPVYNILWSLASGDWVFSENIGREVVIEQQLLTHTSGIVIKNFWSLGGYWGNWTLETLILEGGVERTSFQNTCDSFKDKLLREQRERIQREEKDKLNEIFKEYG